MFKALANKLKARIANKKLFQNICKQYGLTLDYKSNISEINILKEVFVDEVYAQHLPKHKNAIIVDIGAHYGYFSIYAAKNCDASCKIIALEPSEKNRANYIKNISVNSIKNTTLLSFGISDTEKTAYLYHAKNAANYSILNTTHKKSKVELISIAKLIESQNLNTIDFLKMDCEGAEYAALMNCSDETLAKIKCILLTSKILC